MSTLSLLCFAIIIEASSPASSIRALPKELINKIASDYASNQDLISFSQINPQWREVVNEIDLKRIETDYAQLIEGGTITSAEILEKFYHLKGSRLQREIANNHIPCMSRGILFNPATRTWGKKGFYQYLAFLMRDTYLPNYWPSNDDQLKTIICVFQKGKIKTLFCVDNADKSGRIYMYQDFSKEKCIKDVQSIMNGDVVALAQHRRLILLDKPWFVQSAKRYASDWVTVTSIGSLAAFSSEVPISQYLLWQFKIAGAVVLMSVCVLYITFRRARS